MELNGTGAGCLIVCVALIMAVWTIPKACSDIKEMDAAYNKEDTRGEFKDIELEHGVQKNGVRGMNVTVDFNVKGMKGRQGCCSVYFYYENGSKVLDHDNDHLAYSYDINPRYDDSHYTDFSFFIPYSRFNMPVGRYKFMCYCSVHEWVNSSYKQILTSDWAYFSLTR